MKLILSTRLSRTVYRRATRVGALVLALCLPQFASVQPAVGQQNASPSIDLQASGVPASAPDIDIYPDGLPFYDQQVGKLSSVETVSVLNSGTATLTISSIVASAGF